MDVFPNLLLKASDHSGGGGPSDYLNQSDWFPHTAQPLWVSLRLWVSCRGLVCGDMPHPVPGTWKPPTGAGPIPLPSSPELGPLVLQREVHQVHKCSGDLGGNGGRCQVLVTDQVFPGALGVSPYGVWLAWWASLGEVWLGEIQSCQPCW